MLSVKSYVTILAVLIVRAFSPYALALFSAAPLVSSEENWQHKTSNPWARGKSPPCLVPSRLQNERASRSTMSKYDKKYSLRVFGDEFDWCRSIVSKESRNWFGSA